MRATHAARGDLRGAVLALVLFVVTSGAANAQFLFDNFNIYVVSNKPTRSTSFFVAGLGWNVIWIADYHWNNGQGLPANKQPLTISLIDNHGKTWGPYTATSSQNNAYIAPVNGPLPPGWYTVVDSDPDTWSQNAASSGEGFTRVYATPRGQRARRVPPTRAGLPPGFVPCGNQGPAYTLTMSPCIGPPGTTITFVVTARGLAAVLDDATFRLSQARFAVAGIVLPIKVSAAGGGTTPGSIYTVPVPSGLCGGGQYSIWDVYAYDKNGISQGVIGQFTVTGCP